jgi:hypothetical protein
MHDVFAFDISPDGQHAGVVSSNIFSIISIATGKTEYQIDMPDFESDSSLIGCFLSWSPIATDRIAVVRLVTRSKSQLVLINVHDKDQIIIKEAASITKPVWSPDGMQLAWFVYSDELEPVQLSSLPGAGPVQMPISELYVASISDISRNKAIFRGSFSDLQWTSNGYITFKQPQNKIVFIQPNTGKSWYIEHVWNGPSHGIYSISSWEVSPDSTLLAYGFGGKIWVSNTMPGSEQSEIVDSIPLDMVWTPGGDNLLYVTANTGSDSPIGTFSSDTPHTLHEINKDGTNDRTLFSEQGGIRGIKCSIDKHILYLSSNNLYMRELN